MGYTLEKIELRKIIGISVKTSNATFQSEALPLRNLFLEENLKEKIPHRKSDHILTIYSDYEGDHTKPFRYSIGCEVTKVDEIPKGMGLIEIKPATYAVFKAQGPFPQSMLTTWTEIWNSPLKRAFGTDFEIYSPDFDPSKNPEVPIYIGINGNRA